MTVSYVPTYNVIEQNHKEKKNNMGCYCNWPVNEKHIPTNVFLLLFLVA